MLPFLALLLHQADPRLAPAWRKDVAGWVQVHLEGKPRDIGYQYGALCATEIEDAHRALKSEIQGQYDWNFYRDAAKTLFWDKVPQEYKDEIEGQAEGLRSKGVKVDAWDVLAYNANIEIEGYYIPWLKSQKTGEIRSGAKESCSAFIATGSATKDGKIVMGHNLWWGYLMGERANVMLDIKPEMGNRVMMDAFMGMIHSGTDFAINSAGMTLCETTISGFAGFDPKGVPEFVRMRKAIQYSKSMDDMVRIFKEGNNGGYANTWLIGDLNSNTVGKLELGLKNVDLQTTKNGYYVGSNFPESPRLIAEEVPGGWNADPKTNSCEKRRARWQTLLNGSKAEVDAEKAKAFLADTYDEVAGRNGANDGTLCGKTPFGGACNTKVVTADMVRKWQMWARMGFSDGSEMKFSARPGSFLRDIKSQPWTLVAPSNH